MEEKYTTIIKATEEYVKQTLAHESSGHDFWHIERVRNLALHIAQEEKNADLFVIELAALLHDIADHKFHDGDETIGPKTAQKWLMSQGVETEKINHICEIIKDLSFKGANVKEAMKSKEGMIVQDADRLDAIGAIGIARAFAYGGAKGREMHNPTIKPVSHESFETYKKNQSTTINHFYEKLFLLKDRMNTETAKQMAEQRHAYMKQFLSEFFSEWDGK